MKPKTTAARPKVARQFMENEEGTHLIAEAEYTLCGDALEGEESEAMGKIGEMKRTRQSTVTCPRCAKIIALCKGVKCQSNAEL